MMDMTDLFSVIIYSLLLGMLKILAAVFALLFMHYSSKYRNQKLTTGWYVCGVLFGLLTVIVFLIKRKDIPVPETKKCIQCGNNFPDSVQDCPDCHIALPEIYPDEKRKQKKLCRVFGIAYIITYIVVITVGICFGIFMSEVYDYVDYLDDDERISVDGVFYDKMGNSYEDEDSVLLYDEDGHTYLYTAEEADDAYEYAKYYYIRDDGKMYSLYDCYVTADGWFYCDKAYEIKPFYSVDISTMMQEELDEYYDSLRNEADEGYKYYDYPYVDREGNIYYSADEASWNAKGELITAENDIDVK